MGREGSAEKKPVVSFRETKQALVLNKTNAGRLSNSLGAETAAWIGKKVTLTIETYKPGQMWIAASVDGAFVEERRPPTAKEAAKAAQAPLEGDILDDDISAQTSHRG
jgi:hypothetical protein